MMARAIMASCAPLLLLLGCSGGADVPAGDSRMIGCGPMDGGADALRPVCRLEVDRRGDDLRLVIRLPDGGFRRLDWPKGKPLVVADGAQRADVHMLEGGGVDVVIAGWRYRIEPAGMPVS